jgi:hypothetical protein
VFPGIEISLEKGHLLLIADDLLPKKVVHSKREKDSKIRKRSGRRNEEE